MEFKNLKECPFCGHDEFYSKEYVYGTLKYRERFDGENTENGDLYDSLNIRSYNGRAYCVCCDKYLGNRETGALSKGVEKLLKLEVAE